MQSNPRSAVTSSVWPWVRPYLDDRARSYFWARHVDLAIGIEGRRCGQELVGAPGLAGAEGTRALSDGRRAAEVDGLPGTEREPQADDDGS